MYFSEPRGYCKISNVGDDDVQHRGRDVGAGQVQQGLCVRIFISKGIVGRRLTEIAGDVAFHHHDRADVAAGVDVFPLRGEEVQQPTGFVAAQQAGVLLELAVRVHPILLAHFLDFCDVVRVLSVESVGTVGTEAVQAAQRVLEQHPVLIQGAGIVGIITLDVGQTLPAGILHPYIVVGGLLVAQLADDDAVLHGDGVGHSGHYFRQGDGLVGGRCPGAVGKVGFQLHLAGHHRVISEVFRRIVGDRLHRGLPSKEVLGEEVGGTVGQSVHTATDHAEGDLCRINNRGEGARQLGLLVRRGGILEVERQPTVYDVPQVYLGHAADARVVGL